MYELGLRHTTGKLTIQIGERGRLPFDVSAIRTIMFKRTDAGLVQARKDLAKALATNLDSGGDPVTATRIWFESPSISEMAAIEPLAQSETVATDKKEDDSPGFLELLAEMEDATQSLTQTLTSATSITEDNSRIYTETAAKVREADARGGGAAAKLVLANRTAALLDEPAGRMEVVAGDYDRTVQRIEPGLEYLLSRLAEEPDQLADVPDFPSEVRALVDAAKGSIDVVITLQQNSLEMGKAARSLRSVGRRLAGSFKKMADVSQRVSDWAKWLDRFPSEIAADDDSK